MPVVIPPPRRNTFKQLLWPLVIIAVATAVVFFLFQRFADSPIERAEKLFARRDLTELRSFTRKRLEKGDVDPLLYSYFAVAEFSINPNASLASVLGHIRAVDERSIFRREVIERLLQIPGNHMRAGEILSEALILEKPPSDELKNLIKGLVKSQINIASNKENFSSLVALFPDDLYRVKARQVQFRKMPSTEGEVLRRLDYKELLLFRVSGAPTQVSGKVGRWVFVIDMGMNSGWVFDAYLEQESK